MINMIPNRDEEGNLIFKQMFADSSKKLKSYTMTFTTGKYGSLRCRDSEGVDISMAEILFLDASRNELTKTEGESDLDFQARLDLNCKFTWLYFTTSFNFGISKGRFAKKGEAAGVFENWLEFAPHIPKSSGGSYACLEGGFPLDMIPDGHFYQMDGCTCLMVDFDGEYYSHRVGHKIEHEIGDKIRICSIFDLFI